MPPRLLSLMTTTAVVLHALLGCCAHHSHAAHRHTSDEAPATTARVSHCGHPHTHCATGTQHAPSDQAPHGQDEPCHELDCSYVAVQRCDDVDRLLSLPVWLPIAESAQQASGGLLDDVSAATGTPGYPLLPEPLRADTQVWLL